MRTASGMYSTRQGRPSVRTSECYAQRNSLNQFRFFDFGGGLDERGAVGSFRVLKDFAFVIADDDAIGVAADDVIGIDGDFAAATGSVDDVLGDGITGGVSAEALHDFQAFADAGAEVG